MTEAKHTPGPWSVDNSRGISFVRIRRANDPHSPIADIWLNADDHLANARLIAAAPVLLAEAIAARQVIQNMIDAHGDHGAGVMVKALDVAIAKATGEH